MAGGAGYRPAGFPPEYRLRQPQQFSAVFASRRVLRSAHFELRYQPSAETTARLGLVIAKRFARRAVLRNLLKRLAREAFRQLRPQLGSFDIVLRLTRAPTLDLAADVVTCRDRRRVWRQEIEALLARLPR